MTGILALNLVVSSIGFATGGYFLKRFADFGTLPDLGYAFAAYALSNLIYAQVLAKGLGQGAALSSMTHLVLMSVLGVFVFGERLSYYQLGGLMFALCSIVLFTQSNQSV
jgi:drug/metabolite transporter (DMT)-like permease